MATEAELDYEALESEEEDEDRRRRLLPWIILAIIFAIVIWLLWHYGNWGEPNGGTEVTEVSALVSVPNLIGVDGDEAELLLARLGLVPDVAESYDTEGEPGTVSDQDPAPGQQVRQGSAVRIWVIGLTAGEAGVEEEEVDYLGEAKGVTARTRTVETAVVPDVVGLSEDQATARVEALGFVAKPMYQQRSWGDYTVFQQQPPAGTTVEAGFQVHLLIMIP